jgi:hypothetical protein
MEETTWHGSTNWLLLWHYAHEKECLSDRKQRLLAVAACRGIMDLVTDARLLRMIDLAEEWADATTDRDDEWWDRREDWCYAANAAAGEQLPQENSARYAAGSFWYARGAFALLGNDDHKVGRAVEAVAGFYGCPVITESGREGHSPVVSQLIREVVGNPFRPVAFDPAWRTSTAVALAQQMYDSRDFGIMPILGDALQDAGCDIADILDHCRGPGPHVRGCWVVDLVLGKS